MWLIGMAGQLHYQIGAEGRKSFPFGLAQGLPALQPHKAGVGIACGAIGKQEAYGLANKIQPRSESAAQFSS